MTPNFFQAANQKKNLNGATLPLPSGIGLTHINIFAHLSSVTLTTVQSGPITPEKWMLVDVVVRFSLIKESFFFFFTDHQGCFSEISTERSQKKMPLRRVESVPLLMTSVDEDSFKNGA